MKRTLIVLLAACAAMLGARADAHHTFPASYVNRELTIEGELVQILYRNPHSFIQVMTRDSRNDGQRWSVEWIGRARLDQQGITGSTLKPGDRVIVTGFPSAQSEDRWLRARSIFRPKDGWRWKGMVE